MIASTAMHTATTCHFTHLCFVLRPIAVQRIVSCCEWRSRHVHAIILHTRPLMCALCELRSHSHRSRHINLLLRIMMIWLTSTIKRSECVHCLFTRRSKNYLHVHSLINKSLPLFFAYTILNFTTTKTIAHAIVVSLRTKITSFKCIILRKGRTRKKRGIDVMNHCRPTERVTRFNAGRLAICGGYVLCVYMYMWGSTMIQ